MNPTFGGVTNMNPAVRETDTKKILIHVIKNRGACHGPMDCNYCLASEKYTCTTHNRKERYEGAICIFIEKYGKEDLVEVLI